MKGIYLLLIIIGLLLVSPCPAASRQLNLVQHNFIYAQQRADEYYEEQEYKQAARMYIKLGRAGDKFAQHRLSLMYLLGKGLDEDLQDAFAWANLAADFENKELKRIRDEIYSLIPNAQKREALKHARKMYRLYNDETVASSSRQISAGVKALCTGTRLNSNCNRVLWTNKPRYTRAGNAGGEANDMFDEDLTAPNDYYKKLQHGAQQVDEYMKNKRDRADVQRM